jgi:hypothetical protein
MEVHFSFAKENQQIGGREEGTIVRHSKFAKADRARRFRVGTATK